MASKINSNIGSDYVSFQLQIAGPFMAISQADILSRLNETDKQLREVKVKSQSQLDRVLDRSYSCA